jgi:rhomboid protease GluP
MVNACDVPSPESSAESTELRDLSDLVEVGVYPTSKAGFDHGLVILALGDPFWLEPAGDSFRLLVEPHAAARVLEQLACFDRESIDWPPPPVADDAPTRKAELVTPLLWCIAMLASFSAQGEWPGWTTFGELDAQAVFVRGEWWRLLTALFLHADFGHLMSNLVSGIFVFSAVLTTMGRRRGWLLLAIGAIAGNFIAAAMNHSVAYRSLGASTSIFAAVGLLTGRALRVGLRADHPHRWRTLFVPVATGLIVLALYGAGGQQVDVIAHATGFCAGLVLGLIAGAERSVRS